MCTERCSFNSEIQRASVLNKWNQGALIFGINCFLRNSFFFLPQPDTLSRRFHCFGFDSGKHGNKTSLSFKSSTLVYVHFPENSFPLNTSILCFGSRDLLVSSLWYSLGCKVVKHFFSVYPMQFNHIVLFCQKKRFGGPSSAWNFYLVYWLLWHSPNIFMHQN